MADLTGGVPQYQRTAYPQQPMDQTGTGWFAGNFQNEQEPFQQRFNYPVDPVGNVVDVSEQHLNLLRSIHSQLVSMENKLENRTTKTQFIWNAFLQTIGLLIGVLFGAFAILSYSISQTANSQSFVANQLAVLSLCLVSPAGSPADGICGAISRIAASSLPSLAVAVFGPSATITVPISRSTSATSTPTPTGTSSSSKNSTLTTSDAIFTVPPSLSSVVSPTPSSGTSMAPSVTPTPDSSSSGGGPTLEPYGIVGIALGAVAFISIAISTVIFLQRYRKRSTRLVPSG